MDLKNMDPGGGVEDGIHYLNKQQTFFLLVLLCFCWHHRCLSPHLIYTVLEIRFRALGM